MNLRNIAIKPMMNGMFKMFHLTSSFEAELDDKALNYLRIGLFEGKWDILPEQQQMYLALREAGFFDDSAEPSLDIRDASPLLEVEVETTNACDLRCRHCFISFDKDFIPLPLFEKLVVQAQNLGAITLTLNGGEATLHPHLIEMVEKAVQAGLRVRLFTNGCSITQEKAKSLKKAGLSRAYVSLETFQEFHDWLRGPGTWKKCKSGTEALVAAGVEVVVNPTIAKRNLHLMDSFKNFALEELKVASVSFGFAVPLGMAEKNWEEVSLPVEDYPTVLRYATDKRALPEGNRPLSCKAGVNQLFIGARGDVFPCHSFADPKFSFGNLNNEKTNLEDLYKGESSTCRQFREFPHGEMGECASCQQKAICGGGCRARAFLITRKLFGKDPIACARFLGTPFRVINS